MKKGWFFLIAVLGVGLILTAFLVGFSFVIVRPNEIVLVYDRLSQNLYMDPKITEPGSYFVGVSKTLYRFPANNILVEFKNPINDNSTENATNSDMSSNVSRTLSCWTQDGLDVFIDINFYYKINKTNLLYFYKEFGDDWKDLTEQLARKALKETSVLYSSNFYYINRTSLQTAFRSALQASYDSETDYSIQIQYFQVQYIGFGQGFEDSIVAKLVQQHYYNLYNYQGQINLINANTTVFSNNTYNKINLTLANATATGIQNNMNQKSQALVYYLQNMTRAYANIKTDLGVTWQQMYPLMYAIELKTGGSMKKKLSYVPKTVQRVVDSM